LCWKKEKGAELPGNSAPFSFFQHMDFTLQTFDREGGSSISFNHPAE